MKNFALIGAGGYIAPRHMEAIKDTQNNLVAAVDQNDSVGILDRYFPDVRFFTEIERFDRHLEKLKRAADDQKVHFVSVCSPNFLHDAHVRMALRVGADAICEKPLVINPWNIEALRDLEEETNKKVYTVLQLRLLPALIALKEKIASDTSGSRYIVNLSYITRRGPWYHHSWKGDQEKSGGIATNIGIHFFDLIYWLFGEVESQELHLTGSTRMAGRIELERASVRWFLSVDGNDLPEEAKAKGKSAFRCMTIDGEEVQFSDGFTDLHTRVYKDILSGGGFGLSEASQAIELVYKIRCSEVVSPTRGNAHPDLIK